MKSKNVWLVLIVSVVLWLSLFVIMAHESDMLNGRIRVLELKAGMPDPWK